tara:strand:- start:5140 stop:5409 length:270 start_codon:yes stop_codon:yes gene_type:complete
MAFYANHLRSHGQGPLYQFGIGKQYYGRTVRLSLGGYAWGWRKFGLGKMSLSKREYGNKALFFGPFRVLRFPKVCHVGFWPLTLTFIWK